MNVLFCITDLNKGGAEKTLVNICRNTLYLHKNFRAIVISIIGGYYVDVLIENGVNCYVLLDKKKPIHIAKSIIKVINMLITEKNKIDVIHGFMPYGCFLGILCRLIIWKPLIYAIRNSVLSGGGEKNIVRERSRAFAHWISIHYSNSITVNSPYVAEIVFASYKKKALVVMNGIEEPKEDVVKNEIIKKKYYPEKNKFYVVCVCNMRYPQKDIPGLFKVAQLDRNIEYVLVGNGLDLSWFKKLAIEQNLTNVQFAGYQENVYPFLHYANAFITLTRHEGFPNTVLESMVCKCPVVFSNIPEVKGILIHETNALLVSNDMPNEVYKAVLRLLNDKELKNSLVKKGLKMVKETMDMQTFLKTNLAIYSDTIKK